jgi:hypothetical protein
MPKAIAEMPTVLTMNPRADALFTGSKNAMTTAATPRRKGHQAAQAGEPVRRGGIYRPE